MRRAPGQPTKQAARVAGDWRSYDSVAGQYARIAEPRFAALTRDLVDAVAPHAHDRVLDVGCGTGLASRTVIERDGPDLTVIGVDPSAAMLHHARRSLRGRVVLAALPGLPFGSGSFDVAIANLVLSHLTALEDALADVASVLRRPRRFGCTAWGPAEPPSIDNQQTEASDIIDSVRREHALVVGDDVVWPVPWEDRLRDAAKLRGVLADAGFAEVRIEPHTYRHTIPLAAFVAGTEWGARSRYLRAIAGEPAWANIRTDVVDRLHERFGDSISATDTFWIACSSRR